MALSKTTFYPALQSLSVNTLLTAGAIVDLLQSFDLQTFFSYGDIVTTGVLIKDAEAKDGYSNF